MEDVSKKVVWVVGNDTKTQRFMGNYLQDFGYTSEKFASVEECLELLLPGHQDPELIMVLDSLDGTTKSDKATRIFETIRPNISVIRILNVEYQKMVEKQRSRMEQKEVKINVSLQRLTQSIQKLSESDLN